MHIDNVFFYDYENFFNNIFKHYSNDGKYLIKNKIKHYTDNINKNNCLCYMDLFDRYGYNRYGRCILKDNIEKFFPIHDIVYKDDKLQICYLYSKDLKEHVTMMFVFFFNNECKVLFSTDNFMRTINKIFDEPQHISIHADLWIYIPRISNLKNFRLLGNSPPYFFVNDIDHKVHDLEIGEYIGVEAHGYVQSKYTQYIKTFEKIDKIGNALTLDLYKISHNKFDNYIKLINAEIRTYYWVEKTRYFMIS
ncbi:hypothetical protein PBI_SCTP2_297 [Salicola phage SCTP-2]|nr:hypothetical protein PBI_SCTP2_297 [Salicola phage SCTP-2]